MASRWLPPSQDAHRFRIHTDTTDFFRVEYGDVVVRAADPISFVIMPKKDDLELMMRSNSK